MKTNEFTKRMKAELNNENNVFNEFELKLYGVQAYGVTYGEEYNVIVKAARRANGRYYFITREGYEIAWSTLPADQVEHICADMYDQHESDEKAARESYDRLKANGTAHVRAEIMNDVFELADAEGVAVFVLTSGADEINRICYVCSLGTTADEGRAIARAAAADDSESEDTATTAAPAADDLTADDLKAEAEKVARYMMDSAAPMVAEVVGGSFVYHVGHDLPYNLSEAAAERVALYLEDRETIATHALEMGGPSEFFENERAAARAALQRMNAAVIMKTNNKAAREAAARERAKTTSIYNKLADIARETFDLLTIEPGTYTPAKVAEAINKSRAFWREAATAWHRDTTAEGIKAERLTAERWKDTPARVEVEGFACQFPRCQVFEILQRFAVSAGLSSAARVTFTRTADEAAAIAEADERAAERARVLADIDRRQREERRREEKREAERKEAARRAARRAARCEEIKEKAAEILATASADLLAEYMTDAPALCLATACRDTTTTAHDSESRPRALLLTLTRAAVRLAAVVAALLLLTFANDRPTPATATTTAADLLAPADHQDTPAELLTIESADTLTTTAAEVISEPTESEPTARPAADRPAVEKRHHARENKRESRAELMTAAAPAADLLTADTLTAAPVVDRDSLTAPAVVISESESADTTTARPLLTADELAELLALLTGTTTAESEPTAAPADDDSQDTPAEVISEPTESEPTAAPAAGCPAAVATPCPPAAPVVPVAPIIL